MNSNIIIEKYPYRQTGSFKFWCQHVLPLVYDDSLSYYELLCKVVAYINDLVANVDSLSGDIDSLIAGLNGLQKFVNNYFDNLDVQEEINNKLDEMAQNGELNEIINQTNAYTSSELGWDIRRIGDSYLVSINKTESALTEPYLLGQEDPIDVAYCWFTGFIDWILPLPLDRTTVLAQPDAYFGSGINGYVENDCTVKHRLIFFARDLPTGEPVTVNTSINVIGKRATVPESPAIPLSDTRFEIVNVAKSYYDARMDGRHFAYGPNFITYANSDVVNNSSGSAVMECDTLVSLVMLGIPYEDSPYADDTPNLTYNFNDLVVNPNNYTWTLPWVYNDILRRKVTYTGGQCWYYWYKGMVFSDMNQVAEGDIAIFRKPGQPFFDGIRHTGIINIEVVDGERVPYIYHITDAYATGSNMAYEPLANVIARNNYKVDEGELYFARVRDRTVS